MRNESAYSIKQRVKRGATPIHQKIPREGSRLRLIYDAFMSRKLEAIRFDKELGVSPTTVQTAVHNLTDFYGLDIRPGKYGTGYRLVGEWFGRVYVDYSKEAEEQARTT